MERLAGLVETLQGARYPTMTEDVVTLAPIENVLLNLRGPLTNIEPFNMDSGTGRYSS